MENILYPLLGGIIIAIAATILLSYNGRIAGISGILSGAITSLKAEDLWKHTFILGLILGGFILKFLSPSFFNFDLKFSFTEAIIAGLLVGFGTNLGSGCTSGHGVCGIPRKSTRSIIATITFMAAGIVTVYVKGLL